MKPVDIKHGTLGAQPFSFDIDPANKIDGQEVLRFRAGKDAPSEAAFASFSGLDISRAAGFTAFNLFINQAGSSGMTNIFGAPPLAEIEKRFQGDRSRDRANIFFQTGAAPLFPLANRLRDDNFASSTNADGATGDVAARVLASAVKMPRNQGAVHLHGLTFDKSPSGVTVNFDGNKISARGEFASGFYGDQWTGEARLTITHTLHRHSYAYTMLAENTGTTPVPMGMGAHPYFKMPSADYRNLRLHIPSSQLVKIDNYTNVLPTGELTAIPAELDFSKPSGTAIAGRYLDNLWVAPKLNVEGYVYAELIDAIAGLKMKMTALTDNVIGVQAYCPEKSAVVALELVTHLPDPREALWGSTPTEMKLILPGQKMSYGFKVELEKIDT